MPSSGSLHFGPGGESALDSLLKRAQVRATLGPSTRVGTSLLEARTPNPMPCWRACGSKRSPGAEIAGLDERDQRGAASLSEL